jgi:hypothetical protein
MRVVMIAALFVAKNGCYFGLPNVDPWDEARDARLYDGPHAVVAHPPCERWGRYWSGGPSAKVKRVKGDDAGCFEAALHFVRKYGGVLEHPADTSAWAAFGLQRPPRGGGWVDSDMGSVCHVEQGAYGHMARKATWLYAVDCVRPQLTWGRTGGDFVRLDAGFHSAEERARAVKAPPCKRLSAKQNLATPPAFRDLLVAMAESVYS